MSWDYRSIMSGKRKDPLAFLMRAGLRIASGAYALAVTIRNRRYDSGSKEIHHSIAAVISVGNLTTGGTGKTPIVCFLAQWFRQSDLRVAIVSRGYGRGDADANDEAMELHDRLPDVPHVQDADRVEAARVAVEELESQIILMDDGFQHRRLHRDLDIVVIDATCPFGYGYLLPRGLLREPLSGLGRANLIMITRCSLVDEQVLARVEQTIREKNPQVPIVRCDHRPAGLLEQPDHLLPLTGLRGSRVAVISAIGNPDAFEQTVLACRAGNCRNPSTARSRSVRTGDSASNPSGDREDGRWRRSGRLHAQGSRQTSNRSIGGQTAASVGDRAEDRIESRNDEHPSERNAEDRANAVVWLRTSARI